MNSNNPSKFREVFNISVIVAALGYFVDVYDLVLFSIVRIPSLKSIGLTEEEILYRGVDLLNLQMLGMLLGGIFWGILGDRKGRLSVLFGSIFIYSAANLANGFVTDVYTYGALRFIAGIGLAGELGAGITLVAEVMSKEMRGYGTMVVASVGVMGAVFAAFVAEYFRDATWMDGWRISYFIGGTLGLLLLVARISVFESGMFSKLKEIPVSKGNFLSLFSNYKRFSRYMRCILIGLPIWYIIGILITLSPEFAKALNPADPLKVNPAQAVMICYLGLVFGDITSGSLSQLMKSRKKVVFLFLIMTTFFVGFYFLWTPDNLTVFYIVCLALGFSCGFWAIFITIAAEQFGTNLRATVTTTVPNFVRGSLVPVALLFQLVSGWTESIFWGGAIVGIICIVIAFLALYGMEETFGKDLDFFEEELQAGPGIKM